jgi:hypothetical protein
MTAMNFHADARIGRPRIIVRRHPRRPLAWPSAKSPGNINIIDNIIEMNI